MNHKSERDVKGIGGLLHAIDELFHAVDERAGLLRGDGRRDDGRRRWQRMPWHRLDVGLADGVGHLRNFRWQAGADVHAPSEPKRVPPVAHEPVSYTHLTLPTNSLV